MGEPALIGWNTEVASEAEVSKTKRRVAKIQQEMGIPTQPVFDTSKEEPVSIDWGTKAASEGEKLKVKERVAEIKREIGITPSIPKMVIDATLDEPAVIDWKKGEASEEEKAMMAERVEEIKKQEQKQEEMERKEKGVENTWGRVKKFFSSFFGT